MASILAQFRAALETRARCVLCSQLFTARSNGSLACTYHPLAVVNRGANLLGGFSARHRPPSDCTACTHLHVSMLHSRLHPIADAHQRTSHAEHAFVRRGCTPIDHCTDLAELFARPYIAVPLTFLDELMAVRNARAVCVGGERSSGVLRHLRRLPNAVVVHKARQLPLTLHVDLPGTGAAFAVPVRDVYEAMARKFGLPALDDSVREARLADPTARATRMAQYMHRDAQRKDRLRVRQFKKVLFAPFVIFARVSQAAVGAEGGMKLR